MGSGASTEPEPEPAGAGEAAGAAGAGERAGAAGAAEWAGRFVQQAAACDELGSPLWARLLRIVGDDVAAEGPSWSVIRERAELRFGQAGPLRLVGTAHRLALAGDAPGFAELLPSCGGVAPADGQDGRDGQGRHGGYDGHGGQGRHGGEGGHGDAVLRDAWAALVEDHAGELVAGLDREVQTNEVGRAAALGYALAVALGDRPTDPVGSARRVRLIEIGCSGGLNLRLDRFRLDLGRVDGAAEVPFVLGDPDSHVRLAPEMRAPVETTGSLPPLVERIGIDPHPIDPTGDEGRLTLLSFVWPDQVERFERLAAAIDVAREIPARLVATGQRPTAELLASELARPVDAGVATVVQHSVVWQYVPTGQRPAITAVIEAAGAAAAAGSPLVWVRFEPDEWDRTRAAVWVRRWPGGGDRLVAHADYHGRWLAPVPAPHH